MSKFTKCVCCVSPTILRDGEPLGVDDILHALRRAELIFEEGQKKLGAFDSINNLCWTALGNNNDHVKITDVLNILESYC